MTGQWAFDAEIAGAIVNGRMLRLRSLRAIAENSLGPISDKLWKQLAPKWQWHDSMSTDDLQRAGRSPPIHPRG